VDAAADRDDDVGLQLHEIGSIGPHQVHVVGGPTLVEFNVAAARPSRSLQLMLQGIDAGTNLGIGRRKRHQDADAPHALALLRARRERPRRRRAAKQRDEIAAAAHSITSSVDIIQLGSRDSLPARIRLL
jgi:hypothetical protein